MLKKRLGVVLIFAIAIITAILLYTLFARFDDFSVISVVRSENTGRTGYVNKFSGLISYNPDGASLMDYNGSFKWNSSFEMQDPQVDYTDDYLLIYDRRGTVLVLVYELGEVCRINTAYPITVASVANNGNVAVVMQQTNVARVNLYDLSGAVLAEGQLHGSESGYPLSVSLSSSGEQMVISTLHLSESDIKSDVIFYDFSPEGRQKEDSKSAVFSYSDDIIPMVDYVSGDRVLAMGGNGIFIFSAGLEPKVFFERYYETPAKSIFHSDDFFGYIKEVENEENEVENIMEVYSVGGNRKFERKVLDTYSVCELMDNGEIFITNGEETSIYTSFSLEKFAYEFTGEVHKMIPAGLGRTYYLLQGGQLSKIRLK